MTLAVGRRRFALDVLTVLLAISGVVLVVIGGSPADDRQPVADAATPQGPPGPSAATAKSVGHGPPLRSAPAGPAALGPSVPVHLDIPAIGVSTSLMQLGLNPDGTVAVPPLGRDAPAGWYRNMATPGEVGPAVILGHVDSARDGPAVFYRLQNLRPGDTISVRRLDGRTAVFTVSQVSEYPKTAFPTDAVYGALMYPALRLVTCGGAFDRLHRQYRGNIVVYAALTSTR